MGKTCETCAFYAAATSECRRFPPSVVVRSGAWYSRDDEVFFARTQDWPYVEKSDWCGEFRLVGKETA